MARHGNEDSPYVALFEDLKARDCCLELVVQDRSVTALRATLRDRPKGSPMAEVPAALATLDTAALRLRAKLEWAL